MTNFILMMSGFLPLAMGLGFIYRPRKVIRAQTNFRKRMERLEKKLYKNHRAAGLAFVLLGLIVLLTAFYPVWIFHVFLVTRIAAGFAFPHYFEASVVTQIIPTLYI